MANIHIYQHPEELNVNDECQFIEDGSDLKTKKVIAKNLKSYVVKETNEKLHGEIARARNAEDTIQARIDEMYSGLVPSPSEVTDIRVGANGENYGTAGNAVRKQISDINYIIGKSENDYLKGKGYIHGSYAAWDDGTIKSASDWNRTDYIPLAGCNRICADCTSCGFDDSVYSALVAVSWYGSSKNFIAGGPISFSGGVSTAFSPSGAAYVAVSFEDKLLPGIRVAFNRWMWDETVGEGIARIDGEIDHLKDYEYDTTELKKIIGASKNVYTDYIRDKGYTRDMILDPGNGAEAGPFSDWNSAQFIALNGCKTAYVECKNVTITGSTPISGLCTYCWHDSEKNYISGSFETVFNDGVSTLPIPNNAAFLTINFQDQLLPHLKISLHDGMWYESIGDAIARHDNDVSALKTLVNKLQYEINDLKSGIDWDGDYNYLAIGNSITLHPIVSYWWGTWGMAASRLENDYVHKIESGLNGKGTVHTQAYNFATWETQAHDRAETLVNLDKYLSPDLNLVTIQLSENTTDFTTFDGDFDELIKYVKAKAPNARIVVIGDFWDITKSARKRTVAQNNGVLFADLDTIAGDASYQCGMGTTVYGDDGHTHTVAHDGVATHPGDRGMEYIANAVIDLV